jgi:hypothetical protein
VSEFDPVEAARTTGWTEVAQMMEERAIERDRAMSFRSPYAEQMLGYIVNVPCPRCDHAGPHERIGAAMDGSHLLVVCRSFACSLTWKVSGPEIVR